MNVALDLGNTRLKVSFFEKNVLQHKAILDTQAFGVLSDTFSQFSPQAAIFSASGTDSMGIEGFLETYFSETPKIYAQKNTQQKSWIVLDHDTPIPIENAYATPTTLGKDRLAAAVGAAYLFPHRACLFIDSGTCITYNFIDETAQFRGGNISPGLRMRGKAMHQFTARLPLVLPNIEADNKFKWTEKAGIIGRSTIEALENGIVWGLVSEVEGSILRFQSLYPDLKVVLTGGDGGFIFEHLKTTADCIFEPNLVALGLNQILNFNK
jgi:type III pantothenate kinase